ncbi:MAG: hypothetical protein KAR83_07630 [Thermodesulfovibrionales bacterium]|nr:hypothetical protein [Thermodesulfovibrionales bacterium]
MKKTIAKVSISLLSVIILAILAWMFVLSQHVTYIYFLYDVSFSLMEKHIELAKRQGDGRQAHTIRAEHLASAGEDPTGSDFFMEGHQMTLGNGITYVYKRFFDNERKNYEQLSIYVSYGLDKETVDIQEDFPSVLAFYMKGPWKDRASNCFGYSSSGEIVIDEEGSLDTKTLRLDLTIPTQRVSGPDIVPCKQRTIKKEITFKMESCCL